MVTNHHFVTLIGVQDFMSDCLTRSIESRVDRAGRNVHRKIFVIFLLLALIAVPFADEVVGKYQFDSLCRSNGIESADLSRARGKRVKVEHLYRLRLNTTILPVSAVEVRLSDPSTGEFLATYKDYYSSGGWLVRLTPISLGNSSPMLFDGNSCGVKKSRDVFSRNKISPIE